VSKLHSLVKKGLQNLSVNFKYVGDLVQHLSHL